jgi:cell division septum initiation protein DivIVA
LYISNKILIFSDPSINLLNSVTTVDSMRGRWASAALGAGIARYRADQEAQQEIAAVNQANQIEMEKMRASYQHEIDQLKASQGQSHPRPQQSAGPEDPITKLKKFAELKEQGILTEEEFRKIKTELLSRL